MGCILFIEVYIMKKMGKNSKGFTLVEMLLVVVIILILAAATTFGITRYLDYSNETTEMVNEHNDVNDKVQSDIQGLIVNNE